jgi:hypothetical protein
MPGRVTPTAENLLRDVVDVLVEEGDDALVLTQHIADALPEWEMDAARIGRSLYGFGVRTRLSPNRRGVSRQRGYRVGDLRDALDRTEGLGA